MGTARNEGWSTGTCPGCGKSTTWCQRHANGTVICRRGPFTGSQARLDRAGVPLWVWAPKTAVARIEQPASSAPADPQTIHLVYCCILTALRLSRRHRNEWHRRGLTDEAIDRNNIRSWPSSPQERAELAEMACREQGAAACLATPGFYLDGGRPMLAGGGGWVLPAWNLEGRVVALKIRSDRADADPKYYWLSSARRGGPGPGQHARLSWPGRRLRPDDQASVVRVTEGEAKALVLAEATGLPTLSIPGAPNWNKALPWLAKLRTSRVLLCLDADFAEKREVARALLAARTGLQHAGYAVELETWGESWEVRHVAS